MALCPSPSCPGADRSAALFGAPKDGFEVEEDREKLVFLITRGFLAGLLLLLPLPLLCGASPSPRGTNPPVPRPSVRAGLAARPGGTAGLKPVPAGGELGLLELGLCHL